MANRDRDQYKSVAHPDEDTPFAFGSAGYSIKKEFTDATVLVTGGTGYIGSLVVEQLLRTVPGVGRIYLLIRGKRGNPAQARLDRLLSTGLFHMVRDNPALRAKVQLVEGDMNSDDLGLSPTDLDKVLSQTNVVIHSAASIGLEADVQHTLLSNYVGTRRLLALAARMSNLRCFLHVSTAYVNVNFPKGSSVDEIIYPLMIGRQEANHADIVDDLMSLDPASANVRAQMYLDMWDFPNTYTMGKNLTEKLVASYYRKGLPIAIVRPSLVCGLAGDPYPGYCGNLAGPVGMGVAMAVGLFSSIDSVAMVPTHVWDAVPGDVVSSVVLAAAAATSAGARINEYKAVAPESAKDPMVVHAGTSTTYPICMIEAAYASTDFIMQNPAPFRLPGSRVFRIPIDHVPDEEKVKKAKYWTSLKVKVATRFLEWIGQHKTAHRLKYGYMAWEVMNSTKTDKNMFFSSKNLLKLEDLLSAEDAASGHYKITWTLKNGGWPRYIATNLAGMYRNVFGINEVKGLADNDFKFIPNKSYHPASAEAAKGVEKQQEVEGRVSSGVTEERSALIAEPVLPGSRSSESDASNVSANSDQQRDVLRASFKGTAAAFSKVPASGSERYASQQPGGRGMTSMQLEQGKPDFTSSMLSGSLGSAPVTMSSASSAGDDAYRASASLKETASASYLRNVFSKPRNVVQRRATDRDVY